MKFHCLIKDELVVISASFNRRKEVVCFHYSPHNFNQPTSSRTDLNITGIRRFVLPQFFIIVFLSLVFRLQKVVKDVNKYLQSQGSGPWPQNKVSALDRALGEIGRIMEKKVRV